MLYLTESADVAADRHVVRRVGKHQLGFGTLQQPGIGLGPGSIAAQQAVRANEPQISGSSHRRSRVGWRYLVGWVGLLFAQLLDQDVDLRGFKAGNADVKIKV